MHRILAPSAMILCSVFGLMGPAFANDYCPSLGGAPGQYIECIVWNHGTSNDTGVRIYLDTPDGQWICGPLTVYKGQFFACSVLITFDGPCGCRVTGEDTNTRTSLVVDDPDYNPSTAVQCK
jgi:hypothetical protein